MIIPKINNRLFAAGLITVLLVPITQSLSAEERQNGLDQLQIGMGLDQVSELAGSALEKDRHEIGDYEIWRYDNGTLYFKSGRLMHRTINPRKVATANGYEPLPYGRSFSTRPAPVRTSSPGELVQQANDRRIRVAELLDEFMR